MITYVPLSWSDNLDTWRNRPTITSQLDFATKFEYTNKFYVVKFSSIWLKSELCSLGCIWLKIDVYIISLLIGLFWRYWHLCIVGGTTKRTCSFNCWMLHERTWNFRARGIHWDPEWSHECMERHKQGIPQPYGNGSANVCPRTSFKSCTHITYLFQGWGWIHKSQIQCQRTNYFVVCWICQRMIKIMHMHLLPAGSAWSKCRSILHVLET